MIYCDVSASLSTGNPWPECPGDCGPSHLSRTGIDRIGIVRSTAGAEAPRLRTTPEKLYRFICFMFSNIPSIEFIMLCICSCICSSFIFLSGSFMTLSLDII